MSAAQENEKYISGTEFIAQMDALIHEFHKKKPNMGFEEFVKQRLKGKMSEDMKIMLRMVAPELDIR